MLLVEISGVLHIRYPYGDMVESGSLKRRGVRRGSACRGGNCGQTLYQLSAIQLAKFVAFEQIGDDLFHGDSPPGFSSSTVGMQTIIAPREPMLMLKGASSAPVPAWCVPVESIKFLGVGSIQVEKSDFSISALAFLASSVDFTAFFSSSTLLFSLA